MKIIIPDQHVSLKSSRDISLICMPLKKFGITHFVYVRSFLDGSHINFCTNPEWTKFFYNEGKYQEGIFEGNAKLYKQGYFLWSGIEKNELFNEARELFNIDHGITLVKPNKDFCEFFYFGSTPENQSIINFYVTNLDILERFTHYFKDQAKDLINKATKNKIQLCRKDQDLSHDLIKLYKHILITDNEKKNFIDTTEIKKYRFIEGGFYKNISPRELECAVAILKGKSAKLIADDLSLSKRTIESHLNNLKNKLSCFTKPDLIAKLIELGVTDFL